MQIILRCLACALVLHALGAGEDRIAGLRFMDGVSRSLADFAGQHVVLYYHCGHCPTAMGSLSKQAKAVADWIEQNHKPAWLIIITPDLEPAAISSLLVSKGLVGALGANDPANVEKISVNNILQVQLIAPDGRMHRISYADPLAALTKAVADTPGAFAVPVDGITAEPVVAAWWRLERGGTGVLKELAVVARRKGPMQADAQRVVDAAQTAFSAGLAAAGDGFVAYEALERLTVRFDGLDQKPLKTRIGELTAGGALKSELTARDVWRKCQAMLASPKAKDQAAGHDGLAALASRMPDTTYGKMAQAAGGAVKP